MANTASPIIIIRILLVLSEQTKFMHVYCCNRYSIVFLSALVLFSYHYHCFKNFLSKKNPRLRFTYWSFERVLFPGARLVLLSHDARRSDMYDLFIFCCGLLSQLPLRCTLSMKRSVEFGRVPACLMLCITERSGLGCTSAVRFAVPFHTAYATRVFVSQGLALPSTDWFLGIHRSRFWNAPQIGPFSCRTQGAHESPTPLFGALRCGLVIPKGPHICPKERVSSGG